jgi:hypothetical protein
MWEFTVHRYVGPARWTWTQVGSGSRSIRRSRRAFASWAEAFTDATANGFDAQNDGYCLLELAVNSVPVVEHDASAAAA